MKIKSLPKDIQALAFKYKGEQDEQFEHVQDITWNNTDEGYWFWSLVNNGEFGKAKEFKELYENLFDLRCPHFNATLVDNGNIIKEWNMDCTEFPYKNNIIYKILEKYQYLSKNDTSVENLQNCKNEQQKEEVKKCELGDGLLGAYKKPTPISEYIAKEDSSLENLKNWNKAQEDVISTTLLEAYKKPEFEKFKRDYITKEAYKETQGKVDYSEIDWDFITQIAERLNSSKGKYEKDNWKKPMDVNLLIQASLRHMLEILKGNYEDDGRQQGHIEAIVTNMMMLNFQLKKFGSSKNNS